MDSLTFISTLIVIGAIIVGALLTWLELNAEKKTKSH